MNNPRKHGDTPFGIAAIHGGPGAAGEMELLANELSTSRGILEPFQTKMNLEGQVAELKNILEKNGDLPIILIGFSWGAWLSFILAAKHPSIVKKLILIGSGPFEKKYSEEIEQTRLKRLQAGEKAEVISLVRLLNDPDAENKTRAFAGLGKLLSKAETYDPITYKLESIDYRFDIFLNVWEEADELRRSGKLLKLGENVQCPVAAIHGDYDSHPAEGVRIPLSSVLENFSFFLLKKCGHKPWIEKHAKDEFYKILKEELP